MPTDFSTNADLLAAAMRACIRKYFKKKNDPGFSEKNLISLADITSNYSSLCESMPVLLSLVRLYQAERQLTVSLEWPSPEFFNTILPLDEASFAGDANCFKAKAASTGDTLLHCAARSIEPMAVKWALNYNADPRTKNLLGVTPLAYMMRKAELFELFYQEWLLNQPGFFSRTRDLLNQMKINLQAIKSKYDIEKAKYHEASIPDLVKQRLHHIQRLLDSIQSIETYPYTLWSFINLFNRLKTVSISTEVWLIVVSIKFNDLFDTLTPILQNLEKLLTDPINHLDKAVDYSKQHFILNSNELLSEASSEKLRGLASRFVLKLPTTSSELQAWLDQRMIATAMHEQSKLKIKSTDFYENTAWGKMWSVMQDMILYLYLYERRIERRSADPRRRDELMAYKEQLRKIFACTELNSTLVMNPDTAEPRYAECPRDNPVYNLELIANRADPRILEEDEIRRFTEERFLVMQRYLQFRQLAQLIEAGKLAERGPTGTSELHDVLNKLLQRAMPTIDKWHKCALTVNDSIVENFWPLYEACLTAICSAKQIELQTTAEKKGAGEAIGTVESPTPLPDGPVSPRDIITPVVQALANVSRESSEVTHPRASIAEGSEEVADSPPPSREARSSSAFRVVAKKKPPPGEDLDSAGTVAAHATRV